MRKIRNKPAATDAATVLSPTGKFWVTSILSIKVMTPVLAAMEQKGEEESNEVKNQ
jgi:hypothetical protein